MPTYEVQITDVVLTRTIEADNMAEALKIAKELAKRGLDESSGYVVTERLQVA